MSIDITFTLRDEDLKRFEEIVAKVDAVDAGAVRRVTARLLGGKPSVAALGPIARLASFGDIAAKFGSGVN